MDWKQVKAKWSELKGRAKETWGRLTDDDLEVIQGRRDLLVGKLKEVYGLAKVEAERQASEFARSAGAAAGRAAGRARSAGREALSAAKKAGRLALGRALDAADAGLDKVRDMIATDGPEEKPRAQPARPVPAGSRGGGDRRSGRR